MGVSLTDALASPLLASAAQGAFSVRATRAQRRWSEKMYKKYNSPEALVRQYEDAGINPALMFGQSTPAAPTESSVAAMPDNAVGDVVGLLGQLMQLDMLDANKHNVEADTANKEAAARGQNIENDFRPEILRQSLEKGKLDITQAENAISRFADELDNLRADTKNKENQAYYSAAAAMLSIAQKSLVAKQGEQIDLSNAQTRFEQEFQREFGFLPNQPIWNQVTGILGKATNEASLSMDKFTSDLHSLGKDAGRLIWNNIKKVPENVKNNLDWLKFLSY